MANILEKRVFLIVTADPVKARTLENWVRTHVHLPTIYTASDGTSAIAKLQNAPPHVLITDLDLPKLPGQKVIEMVLKDKALASTVVIIAEPPPERETYIDELVRGKVGFVTHDQDESAFTHALFSALNYVAHDQEAQFYLRFLAQGESLIREGERGNMVYIVRQGRLTANRVINGAKVELGYIEPGEFVGEMAYIQDQPRVADVEALTDCELIEVPAGTLDRILYRRPSWSKALMLSLSKRLAQANRAIAARIEE